MSQTPSIKTPMASATPAPVVNVTHTGSLWERCLMALAVLVLILGYRAYREERADRAQMEATVKAQQIVINQQAQAAKAAADSIVARDALLIKTVGALQAVKAASPGSPAETAAEISKYLALPAPPAVAGQNSPAPAVGSVIFTPPEAEGLRQAAIGCAEDAAKLTACQKDASDRAAQLASLDAQIKALTAQRDEAVKTAKGGSFFTRLKRESRDVAIGVGIGVVVGVAARR